MTKIGLLGAGRIGQVHARAVSSVPSAQLVAVADPMPTAAEALRDTYGCEIRTIAQIRDSADIDAVIICTPTDTHANLIEDFARAGKAIFCEKPVDLDLSRVKACLKVVDEMKATLMVGFQRRFDPDFQAELARPMKCAAMSQRSETSRSQWSQQTPAEQQLKST